MRSCGMIHRFLRSVVYIENTMFTFEYLSWENPKNCFNANSVQGEIT